MNQVTNLKSLGFTGERIANLRGIFPEVVLCDIDFRGFFDVDLQFFFNRPFCGRLRTKLVLFSSVAEADDSPALTLRSLICFHVSSLHVLYWGIVFLIIA